MHIYRHRELGVVVTHDFKKTRWKTAQESAHCPCIYQKLQSELMDVIGPGSGQDLIPP